MRYLYLILTLNLAFYTNIWGCETFSGTMPMDTVRLCPVASSNPVLEVLNNGDESLEPNELIEYIMHDNATNVIGIILGKSKNGNFEIDPFTVSECEIYYVSVVAGEDDGNGEVDLSDPCTSVSVGTPFVYFYIEEIEDIEPIEPLTCEDCPPVIICNGNSGTLTACPPITSGTGNGDIPDCEYNILGYDTVLVDEMIVGIWTIEEPNTTTSNDTIYLSNGEYVAFDNINAPSTDFISSNNNVSYVFSYEWQALAIPVEDTDTLLIPNYFCQNGFNITQICKRKNPVFISNMDISGYGEMYPCDYCGYLFDVQVIGGFPPYTISNYDPNYYCGEPITATDSVGCEVSIIINLDIPFCDPYISGGFVTNENCSQLGSITGVDVQMCCFMGDYYLYYENSPIINGQIFGGDILSFDGLTEGNYMLEVWDVDGWGYGQMSYYVGYDEPENTNCDDGNCETEDVFNTTTCECEYIPIGIPICDDGDCMTEDVYDSSTCNCEFIPIEVPVCDDGLCDTADSYDSSICQCVFLPIDVTIVCDDGDCTTDDIFNEMTCDCEFIPIEIPVCDDGDCTTDDVFNTSTCNCEFIPIVTPVCDDGDCTTEDTFNTSTCECEFIPIAIPVCDDGDCTTDDIFNTSTCDCEFIPIAIPICDDGDCTTEDTFNTSTCDCEFTPIAIPVCDDGNPNTTDSFNPLTCECEFTPTEIPEPPSVTPTTPSKILLPSAFTPDNDGMNDKIRILNPEISDVNWKIYDRWGKMIFEANDVLSSWDGTVNGTPQPIGTYICVVVYSTDEGEKIYSQEVVLIR